MGEVGKDEAHRTSAEGSFRIAETEARRHAMKTSIPLPIPCIKGHSPLERKLGGSLRGCGLYLNNRTSKSSDRLGAAPRRDRGLGWGRREFTETGLFQNHRTGPRGRTHKHGHLERIIVIRSRSFFYPLLSICASTRFGRTEAIRQPFGIHILGQLGGRVAHHRRDAGHLRPRIEDVTAEAATPGVGMDRAHPARPTPPHTFSRTPSVVSWPRTPPPPSAESHKPAPGPTLGAGRDRPKHPAVWGCRAQHDPRPPCPGAR